MIDNLYYGSKPCPCCSGKPQNISASIEFSPQVLEGFLRKIYEGFDTAKEIEPTAWREVLRILNEGAVEGLSQSSFRDYEQNFLRNIRHSNEVFSAFKVHSWGSLMQERLLDEEGKLRPFKEWKKLVAPISNHHVGSWLKTEYDTAIIRAHQASQWQEFVANKDIFPNLRWMPTTSPSPEVLHKGFADRKLTKPVNDPFWEVHHPGNRWNCKCSLNATDDPATEDIDDDIDTKKPTAQRGLEKNPKDGQLFSDKHPYFPENCNACPFYRRSKGVKNWVKGLLKNREKDCLACQLINKSLEGVKSEKLRLTDEQKAYRKKLQDEAKEKYKGKEIDSEIGKIRITVTGIKEFLNQPHEKYFEKNELVRELPKLIQEAKYIGYLDYHKINPNIKRSHILKTDALGDNSVLVVREEITGGLSLYSISDSLNFDDLIKKE